MWHCRIKYLLPLESFRVLMLQNKTKDWAFCDCFLHNCSLRIFIQKDARGTVVVFVLRREGYLFFSYQFECGKQNQGVSRIQIALIKTLLNVGNSGNVVYKSCNGGQINARYDASEYQATPVGMFAGEKIVIVDFSPIQFHGRCGELIDPGVEFVVVGKCFAHNSFARLWQKTASAIKNRSDLRFACVIVEEKAPVSVMTVKISKQRIDNKHIPEALFQNISVDLLLAVDGIQNGTKLGSASVAFGFQNGILDGTKIQKTVSIYCEVLTGADSFYLVTNAI